MFNICFLLEKKEEETHVNMEIFFYLLGGFGIGKLLYNLVVTFFFA